MSKGKHASFRTGGGGYPLTFLSAGFLVPVKFSFYLSDRGLSENDRAKLAKRERRALSPPFGFEFVAHVALHDGCDHVVATSQQLIGDVTEGGLPEAMAAGESPFPRVGPRVVIVNGVDVAGRDRIDAAKRNRKVLLGRGRRRQCFSQRRILVLSLWAG